MKVKLYLQETVEDFSEDHSNGKKLFNAWLYVIKNAEWGEPADITKTAKGNLLGNGCDRVVFDIGGNGKNAFRIICGYKFGCPYKKSKTKKVHLYVNWIGTHEEYNALTDEQKRNVSQF
jgi:mRNA-degrading endonuclease HigB of HigAB toxin-antitoxin module